MMVGIHDARTDARDGTGGHWTSHIDVQLKFGPPRPAPAMDSTI